MSAIDTHAHIYPPAFPIPEGPGHKPAPYERKTREEYFEILERNGRTHGVLVQPSGYQTDNGAMLDAMDWSKGKIKGIGMVPYEITDRELAALAARGMVGNRFNLYDLDPDEFRNPAAVRLLERLRDAGWFAEIHVFAPQLPELAPLLERSGGKLIFCHMGRPDVPRGVGDSGFQRFLEFGRSGQGVAKLTGAIRLSKEAYPFRDVDPFVEAILEAYTPQRCIWGSDWPFVLLKQGITYEQVVAWFERVVPRAEDRQTILWETPTRLFGFS